MARRKWRFSLILGTALAVWPILGSAAETFTVASYNLENYTDASNSNRPLKTGPSQAKVHESIVALHPDVIGLQEIGSTNMLLELREALQRQGVDYPFWEHVSGFDTNINVAVLSRFPITARRPHTQDGFLLNGRRFRLARGIAELDIQINPNYGFTLFVAHLKSKRASPEADEAELREQEALVLREKIEARLRADPLVNVLVVGDFNDTKDARAIRTIIGRGRFALLDTRPAERNGDAAHPVPARANARTVTWTHFYAKEDSYLRLDYILANAAMAREWRPAGTYILSIPNWGIGSDHRPIIAEFDAKNH